MLCHTLIFFCELSEAERPDAPSVRHVNSLLRCWGPSLCCTAKCSRTKRKWLSAAQQICSSVSVVILLHFGEKLRPTTQLQFLCRGRYSDCARGWTTKKSWFDPQQEWQIFLNGGTPAVPHIHGVRNKNLFYPLQILYTLNLSDKTSNFRIVASWWLLSYKWYVIIADMWMCLVLPAHPTLRTAGSICSLGISIMTKPEENILTPPLTLKQLHALSIGYVISCPKVSASRVAPKINATRICATSKFGTYVTLLLPIVDN
jgi:hypothetical protein